MLCNSNTDNCTITTGVWTVPIVNKLYLPWNSKKNSFSMPASVMKRMINRCNCHKIVILILYFFLFFFSLSCGKFFFNLNMYCHSLLFWAFTFSICSLKNQDSELECEDFVPKVCRPLSTQLSRWKKTCTTVQSSTLIYSIE